MNEKIEQRLSRLGLMLPRLLLPRAGVDLGTWAIIACDQFSNDIDYWKEVERIVGNTPSTLHYIIPEIYLEMGEDEVERRVKQTQQRMQRDLANGTLIGIDGKADGNDEAAVWVRRHFTDGSSRDGLLFALDLECYHYQREAGATIQATEETFADRIEPRRAIREQATLELPHILVFYNDPAHTVRAALANDAGGAAGGAAASTAAAPPPLYQAELMCGGGELNGYRLYDTALTAVVDAFEQLRTVRKGSGGTPAGDGNYQADAALDSAASDSAAPDSAASALFFVGDGNHSLAAAREHWQELKQHGAAADHPARHALVELINIHDPGVKFEPIHKYLVTETPAAAEELWQRLTETVVSAPPPQSSPAAAAAAAADSAHAIRFHDAAGRTLHHFPPASLPADVELQRLLVRVSASADADASADAAANDRDAADADAANNPPHANAPLAATPPPLAIALLFAHDRSELMQIATMRSGITVEMPPLDRSAILNYIAIVGVLPRKSFSLGKSEEKRYYVECRRITPAHP